MTEWKRLCALIDDDVLVAEGVVAAVSAQDDAWTALIDGLDDAGALAYLEASDSGMELADALEGLPRVFRVGVDLGAVSDTDELEDAIVVADAILEPHDLRLVYLAEDSDAFPLVVVPRANAEEIVRLAAQHGHEARVFG